MLAGLSATFYRLEVTAQQGERERRTFPALDPEPPPRPWWRRLLAPVAVIVIVGAVVAGVAAGLFSSGRPGKAAGQHAAAASPGGRVVALTTAGTLTLADPDGKHVTTVSALGNVGQYASLSPDDRFASLGNGQVAIVRRAAALAPYAAKVALSSDSLAAWPDAFADHARDLVMLAAYGYSESAVNPVSVDSVATGRPLSLGTGDVVEGDPQAAGAFLSVAAPAAASATVTQVNADSRIELRDAGRPAVVLATASALNRDVGQSEQPPVGLSAYPDPAGDKVAVLVAPASGSSQVGMVVLSRAGHVLYTVASTLAVQGTPAWSPSGRSLAYVSSGGHGGLALRIWPSGGQATSRPLPATGYSYDSCLWSPDGASVLCAAAADWEITRAGGGALASVHGTGRPIGWLP